MERKPKRISKKVNINAPEDTPLMNKLLKNKIR
jgi:hypothetical protein